MDIVFGWIVHWTIEGNVENVRYKNNGICAIAIDSGAKDVKRRFVYHVTQQLEMCNFAERAKWHDVPVRLDGFLRYGDKFYSAHSIDLANRKATSSINVNDASTEE